MQIVCFLLVILFGFLKSQNKLLQFPYEFTSFMNKNLGLSIYIFFCKIKMIIVFQLFIYKLRLTMIFLVNRLRKFNKELCLTKNQMRQRYCRQGGFLPRLDHMLQLA